MLLCRGPSVHGRHRFLAWPEAPGQGSEEAEGEMNSKDVTTAIGLVFSMPSRFRSITAFLSLEIGYILPVNTPFCIIQGKIVD